MRLIVSMASVVVASAFMASVGAQTLSFRCKNDLVNIGASKASALQKCGEPVVKDSFCKPADRDSAQLANANTQSNDNKKTVIVNNTCESVDEWTYNPGTGQFMTTLRFESGKLVAITYGDRVK
jgi:superfamily II DNA/RNA helicase